MGPEDDRAVGRVQAGDFARLVPVPSVTQFREEVGNLVLDAGAVRYGLGVIGASPICQHQQICNGPPS